jgi:hypothetical protein
MRLYVDGTGQAWAIVRCNTCTDVDKYPALDALDAPVICKCGQRTDVRDALIAEVNKRPDARRELRNLFGYFAQDDGAITVVA